MSAETIPGVIVTYSGAIINPLEPDLDAIHIEDIAHALANSCRFTGHVREFYSVAQHSVICSQIVPADVAREALFHDASEAYLSDVSRPVKQQEGFAFYKTIEQRLERALALKFGLTWPWPKPVKWADDVLLRSEQRDLMPNLLRVAGDDYLPYAIDPWTPRRAKRAFLDRFYESFRPKARVDTSPGGAGPLGDGGSPPADARN